MVLLLVIGIVVGILCGIAALRILRHRDRVGIRVAVTAVLVNLVAGGLLTFYVAQFGAMASTIQHLLLLVLVLDYARRLGPAQVGEGTPIITPT